MNKWLNLPVGIALAVSLLLIALVPAIGLLGLIGTLIAATVIYKGKTQKEMGIPKDFKKVIKERERLESDLNLAQTIYETLKLIEDEYYRKRLYPQLRTFSGLDSPISLNSSRDPEKPKSWKYKTISVEDIECARTDDSTKYSMTVCVYSFDHNKDHYSVTMELTKESSSPYYTTIYVYNKSNKLTVFEAIIDHDRLFRQVKVGGFLPQEEWYTTLLARLEAFRKEVEEVYSIIRAKNRAENKKRSDESEREHIKNLREKFIGK